jgi:hypothetical protein
MVMIGKIEAPTICLMPDWSKPGPVEPMQPPITLLQMMK